ncbi:hypothetical protein AAJCM20276_25630 [Acetobacter aceti]|uniref:Uncharacterized protein n=1 Tax=Acetobacter aceti TaxID=435 RepID=A0A6S6PKN3_ACEAC|nr:hypothetical protein AAJCM20276_25630 [Acetobacter aceti]
MAASQAVRSEANADVRVLCVIIILFARGVRKAGAIRPCNATAGEAFATRDALSSKKVRGWRARRQVSAQRKTRKMLAITIIAAPTAMTQAVGMIESVGM